MADAKQEVSNGSVQTRAILAKPRLGGFGSSSFGAPNSGKSKPFGSVLRPPQLKAGNNPFLKTSESDESLEDKTKDISIKNIVEDSSEDKLNDDGHKFVPLGSANVTARTNNPAQAPAQPASSAGFVFGQNLSDRVVMNNNGDAGAAEHAETNGSTENASLLFSNAAANVKDSQDDVNTRENNSTAESLAAAAAEYERSHARPLPATSNCTMTGEEGENNVLQISCRLFAWESGSWRERGRGVLRLNDAAEGAGSRLVVRVAGSLRVVLNTKLWPEMVAERAGNKSLRVTAADAQQLVKLYLIMGAPGDIAQLHKALTSRIPESKKPNACKQNETSQEAAERLDHEVQDAVTADRDTAPDHQPEQQHTSRLKDNETSDLDTSNEDKQDKAMKRKEPIKDETSPKRQCSEVVTQ